MTVASSATRSPGSGASVICRLRDVGRTSDCKDNLYYVANVVTADSGELSRQVSELSRRRRTAASAGWPRDETPGGSSRDSVRTARNIRENRSENHGPAKAGRGR
jgi:hypothetical protein